MGGGFCGRGGDVVVWFVLGMWCCVLVVGLFFFLGFCCGLLVLLGWVNAPQRKKREGPAWQVRAHALTGDGNQTPRVGGGLGFCLVCVIHTPSECPRRTRREELHTHSQTING